MEPLTASLRHLIARRRVGPQVLLFCDRVYFDLTSVALTSSLLSNSYLRFIIGLKRHLIRFFSVLIHCSNRRSLRGSKQHMKLNCMRMKNKSARFGDYKTSFDLLPRSASAVMLFTVPVRYFCFRSSIVSYVYIHIIHLYFLFICHGKAALNDRGIFRVSVVSVFWRASY